MSSRQKRAALAVESSELVLPLGLFQTDDSQQMGVAMEALAMHPEVVLHYLLSDVFGKTMRHQVTKLQASGVDLGSDMLFGTRLGFSGTPSELVPQDLKPCHFEPGSEAKIIRVLTSKQYVNYQMLADWNVRKLLLHVARAKSPPYHALIDTGALVTGMSNEEVARFLLQEGLKGLDAAVYLNASDRKMVRRRACIAI